jgi:GntR family transcriptional repressor for pyruvate dehydrogenase complex
MQEKSFKQVHRTDRLSIQVAEQIADMILDGGLTIGERLPPERELCGQFGVSRTVIREAVRILEAKGLLKSQSGSGTYVRALKPGDVSDSLNMYLTTQSEHVTYEALMEIRRVLEVGIAALAAERAGEESIRRLESILSKMEASADDPDNLAKFDVEFHVALAKATGNHLFALLLDPFMEAIFEAVLVSNLSDPFDLVMEEHRRIFQKVKARDADGAAEAMRLALDQETLLNGAQEVSSQGGGEKG